MKHLKKIFVLVLGIGTLNLFAQKQIDYTPIRSIGVPPSHMGKSAIEKNEEKEVNTSPYRPRNERLAEIEFYSSSTYSINDLLVSGDVIYGEQLQSYLTKVLDHILQSNDINNEVFIHPVKSSVFNAFATEEPTLFVNIGLLLQVRNEAELAFVICHELAHHLNKHSLEGYLEEYKLDNMKEYSSMSGYDKILKKHGYSRNMENAADSIGMIYFRKTKYHLQSAVTVFDLMKDGVDYYTLDDFSSSIDFKGYYNSLGQSKLDSLGKIHIRDTTLNEELSTHPETGKRKQKIIDMLQGANSGEEFVQSKSDFEAVKKIAFLESLRLSLLEENYVKAYFLSHMIMKKYEEYTFYAKKQMFKALIGIMDEKIPCGPEKENYLAKAKLRSTSPYLPVLYYFNMNSNQDLVNDISNLIEEELLSGNADEELKALNNWFIKKVDHWNKTVEKLSTSLKERQIKELSLANKKKIFVDPYFLSIDFRKVYMLDYIKTEKEQIKVKKKMTSYLKQRDAYSMVSIADKSQITAELLYEKEIITKRLIEIEKTSDHYVSSFPTDYYQVNEICDKYQSQKVSVTFAATAYYKSNSTAAPLLLLFFAPLGIYLMTVPNYITIAEYQEFDLINGKIDNKKSLQKKSKFSGSPVRELYFPITK